MAPAVELRRWTFALAACGLLVYAAHQIVRRSAADVRARSSRSIEEVESACLADPGRASCWARLAEARELLGADASAEWRQSIALNTRDASVLTQAAMAAESRGQIREAERLLLAAETYNHLWLPRWTLANFYYRRQRKPEFWRWMRAAFERSYGDPTAAFRLCRDAGGTPSYLFDHVLPPSPEILNAFVLFLIEEEQLDDLPGIAERYAKTAPPNDHRNVTAALTAAADALLGARRAEPAIRLWNHLARRGYIPYGEWSPHSPIFNGTFQPPLSSPAFDWRAPKADGITVLFGAPIDSVKISLSGRQPENAELLTQYLVLPPGQRYDFAFDVQTTGIGERESALHWTLVDVQTQDPYPFDSPDLWSPAWNRRSIRIETPDDSDFRLVRLSLIAGRKLGFARMEGEVWFRRLRMEAY